MTEQRKMLEPLLGVVSVALRVVIGVAVLGFVLSLFVDDIHFGGLGRSVCVTSDGMSADGAGMDTVFGPKAGVDVSSVPRYCTTDPSAGQKLLQAAGTLPPVILALGGLWLLNRLLQGAAREGVYTARTASRLRVLGWWTLVGGLVAAAAQAASQAALLATLAAADGASPGNVWDVPLLSPLVGLGLLTFARIVRAGTAMREDIEATI
ncbi:DUF2975 domain-containing protein [Streptomyces sp. ITFR-16]|uniref:DUF2975 domain-containing protein n=1 Tax=Streptomyces sp. ITFR-16 TaxID=3075198 RepID=UPI00288BBE23|nr:DUF2975 domain-containing protein [Streptomyces sp. ITFR-16]WNI26726.1 DUF2975 domain-containing protein [Streptomyces sp. ITFR-16]